MPTDWTAATRHLARRDRALAPLIRRVGPPTITPTRAPLTSLGRAIVYQQLSGAAAGTIYRRFTALYGGRFPSARRLAATSPEALRACGLSFGKIRALHDLAAHVGRRAVVPARLPTMTDAEIAAALLPVLGIGPWSVDMFLMFALARPDVLPTGDLGVQKGMQRHFGLRSLPSPAAMEQLAAPWRPFRTAGAWYMWRLLEQA
ncbi:MAG: hypothetical protein R2939_09670 [Kofleriaceae bacterium]